MTQQEFAEKFEEVLKSMLELVKAKSQDYAGSQDALSNLKMCEKGGIPAWKGIAAVRMADKFSRILNFCKTEDCKVKTESLEDTLIDMANYSIICMIAYRELNVRKTDPNGNDRCVIAVGSGLENKHHI